MTVEQAVAGDEISVIGKVHGLSFFGQILLRLMSRQTWQAHHVTGPVLSSVTGETISGFVMLRSAGWSVEFRECTDDELIEAYEWWATR